jgi:hypothetical protein
MNILQELKQQLASDLVPLLDQADAGAQLMAILRQKYTLQTVGEEGSKIGILRAASFKTLGAFMKR